MPPPTLFCHSLRRRSSYSAAVAKLLAQTQYDVRESALSAHDVAVPVGIEREARTDIAHATRYIRFLLLSPSALADAKLHSTQERIQHFAVLTPDPIGIVFLLNPPPHAAFQAATVLARGAAAERDAGTKGVLALTKLQTLLMEHPDLPRIPLLPLHCIEELPDLLKNHAAKYVSYQADRSCSTPTSEDLMKLCTVRQPMQIFTANVLSDSFDNLRDMAYAMTRQPDAQRSSSPTAIAAFALDVLSQPPQLWDPNGRLHMPSDDATPQGRLRTLEGLVGKAEVDALKAFWNEDVQL